MFCTCGQSLALEIVLRLIEIRSTEEVAGQEHEVKKAKFARLVLCSYQATEAELKHQPVFFRLCSHKLHDVSKLAMLRGRFKDMIVRYDLFF